MPGASGDHDDTATETNDIHTSVDGIDTNQEPLYGPHAADTNLLGGTDGPLGLLSPYAANRMAIRNLTLPTMPRLDIPPSPPGSPPPGMEQKFEHFVKLKNHGIHFNEKLAGSSALKNPGLLQKLMASAGLAETDQYATPLPQNLCDPSVFPDWAYKEGLASSQQKVTKSKEEGKTQAQQQKIDFVPATGRNRTNIERTVASLPSVKQDRVSAAALYKSRSGE
ncbi:MAG: hypothetical protein Q9222_000111 [Ikaeria aurantiellina]